MFARNEKYGQALHLRYGPELGAVSDDATVNRHFGVASFLQSMRKRIRLASQENAVEVDLENGPLGKTVKRGYEMKANAVNENCLSPDRAGNRC